MAILFSPGSSGLLEEAAQAAGGAVDVVGTDTAGGGGLDVEHGGVAGVEGFGRGNAESVESMVEDGRRWFPGPGVGGGDDEVEKRRESEAFEDGVQAEVEVGNDGESEAGVAGRVEDVRDLRENDPGLGAGVVVEEGGEGGVGDRVAEGGFDEISPPGAFGRVAVGVAGKVRLAEGGEGAAETGFELGGGEVDAVLAEDPGVGFADGLGEVDERAGGVEEKGADHGGRMATKGT